MRRFDFKESNIPRDIIKRVPKSIAENDAVIPVEREEDGTLLVVTSDPTDAQMRDKLRYLLNRKVRFAFAPRAEILAAVAKNYESAVDERSE